MRCFTALLYYSGKICASLLHYFTTEGQQRRGLALVHQFTHFTQFTAPCLTLLVASMLLLPFVPIRRTFALNYSFYSVYYTMPVAALLYCAMLLLMGIECTPQALRAALELVCVCDCVLVV